MKYKSTLLVVKNMEKSKRFYNDVLGLAVVLDFGANVTLTGGISLQSEETWRTFIDGRNISYKGNASELYFEEPDFDGFAEKLDNTAGIEYVHHAREHSWGQRVVRFYDPDGHIIEVGESMKTVVLRFAQRGLSVFEIAKRMDVPESFVQSCLS